MYCIGLIGTIASGKSTVAALFAKLGVDVISADHIARELTAPGEAALAEIVAHFGPTLLDSHQALNRAALRDIIFQSPKDKLWLEALLHPMIRERISQRVHQCITTYCIIEIPLLKQRGDYPYLNRILWVSADEAQQIHRAVGRDQCRVEQVMSILSQQKKTEHYHSLADDVLVNNQGIEELQQAVQTLHDIYLGYAYK